MLKCLPGWKVKKERGFRALTMCVIFRVLLILQLIGNILGFLLLLSSSIGGKASFFINVFSASFSFFPFWPHFKIKSDVGMIEFSAFRRLFEVLLILNGWHLSFGTLCQSFCALRNCIFANNNQWQNFLQNSNTVSHNFDGFIFILSSLPS